MKIIKDASLAEQKIPFAYVEVTYPDKAEWHVEEFYAAADKLVEDLKVKHADYDRKVFFGENKYVRFFKKFKKTYPVLLQFESFLLKGRPFPRYMPVAEVPFAAEVETQVLMGTHDIELCAGDVVLKVASERMCFTGMRGEEAHTYPNDVYGTDDEGTILDMISGADQKTCCHDDSYHVFYPVFGVPEQDPCELEEAANVLIKYVKILCPTAKVECFVL